MQGSSRLISRLVLTLFVLWTVATILFLIFRLMPGSPLAAFVSPTFTPEQQDSLRRQFGLDQSLLHQYLLFIGNLLQGDLGESFFYKRPVGEVVMTAFANTIALTMGSLVVAYTFGVLMGAVFAWKRGTWFEGVGIPVVLVTRAAPEFWLGMMLLIVFSVGAFGIPGFFPVGGMSTPGVDTSTPIGWLNVLWHLVLPCSTLILIYLADYALVMRASLIDERKQEYLTLARAKGLRDAVVRKRHAVPNALLPTITLIFLSLGFVVTGAITVETVFSWPGLGLLTYEALRGPDIPLLQAIFLMFSIAVIVANLIAELLYVVFDPRVRS